MTITRGRAVTAAVITVLSLGLAACSGDDAADTSTEESSTETSAEPTEEATEEVSEEPTTQEETSAPAGDGDTAEFIALMTAGLDKYTTATFTMEMVVSGQSVTSSGQLDYTTDPLSMSMEMTGVGAEAITMLMVDGQQFMQMPSMTGEKWIVVDDASTDLSDSDPLAQMRAFEKGITAVELIGQEEAGGVPATHYLVTLDSARMAETGTDVAGMPPEITYDLWLDSEGRTVKMSFALEVEGISNATTMTLTDLDQPVNIVAPSADQIMEMPSQG